MPKKRKRDRSNPYRWSMRAGKPQAAPKQVADDTQRAPEPVQVDTARSQSDNIADRGSGAEREAFQVDSTMSQSDPSSSSSISASTTPSDRVISGQRETALEQSEEEMQARRYPLHHLSVRVPWHDDRWLGKVCKAPHLNGACTKITRIGREKKDEVEVRIAGKSYENLLRGEVPYCFQENSAFMAEFPMDFNLKHDQAYWLGFLPAKLNIPPHSLITKPFRWLKKNNLEEFNRNLRLDLDISREAHPDFDSSWLNDADNIEKILGAFKAHLEPQNSLCFIYATHVPFIEGEEKVLIGVGRISRDFPDLTVYEPRRDGPRKNGPEGRAWEMPIQHSIRPNGRDGFLLPYHQILEIAEQNTELGIEIEPYLAMISPELGEEFSNGSELVSNDGAIAALISLDDSLTKIEQDPVICQYLDFDVQRHRRWIGVELARLGTIRASFPGLGSVLQAIEITKGLPVAIELQGKIGGNEDPWPKVAEAFQDPSILPKDLRVDIVKKKELWNNLTPERRKLLKLLSQFEINEKQASAVINKGLKYASGEKVEDAAILWNPYIIYEAGRREKDGIPLLTIDRGVILIQSRDESASTTIGLYSGLDPRRIKAFTISALEDAASDGHTVQSLIELAERVNKIPGAPKCPVSPDILSTSIMMMQPEVLKIQNMHDETYIQLKRYHDYDKLICDKVLGTMNGRLDLEINWADRLEAEFGKAEESKEVQAQREKAAALKEIANSQMSVLIGPAGTGKTTLLKILCSEEEIRKRSILLLAPTGKARVRMEELAGGAVRAMTVAQHLYKSERFDPDLNIYRLSYSHPHAYGTVIVDEASMLTEDMLAALFDSVKDVDRFILIGDPSQLPPIGAGRPFVDIVNELRPPNTNSIFPRVGNGYAELTVERRQSGDDSTARQLANWFSSLTPRPDDDSIFTHPIQNSSSVRFVEWHKPDDFKKKFIGILAEELELTAKEDAKGFNRKALGARPSKREFDEFIPTGDSGQGSVAMIDKWQVLSPLKGMPFGIYDINLQIHKTFRAEYIRNANKLSRARLIPKPYGAEQIVYGDKIINTRNHPRSDVLPSEDALQYVANGEIGLLVGQLKEGEGGSPPSLIKVEFSSQPKFVYDFDPNGNLPIDLELAYALTVHKAQGSQFDLVILVLPKEHRIMSRELIYTALTRHRRRVVVMHQGSLVHLKELTEPHRSEIARRRTNLFAAGEMYEVRRERGNVFLEDGLMHRTGNGLAVRSKSELLIAEAFESMDVPFRYEQPLQRGGKTYFPDFTISDEITGRTVYWEHLGMLDDENYVKSWNKKLSWYRSNGILPYEENRNGDAVLVTTQDSPQSGLDMAEVRRLIQEVCGG